MKITIRKKLFALVAIITVTYGLAVGFILVNFRDKLSQDAKLITIAHLNENASSARAIINGDFEIARTVAQTLANTVDFDSLVREQFTGRVLEGTVQQSPRYLSAWLSMELSAIDPNWTKPYGRKRSTFYKDGSPVFDVINANGDVPNSLYAVLKASKAEELTEPYLLSSTSSIKDNRNDFLGTSICVPLLKDGNFIGLAGMDITLEALDFIAKIKPYEGASSFLVSNDGLIVSHASSDRIGKRISSLVKKDTTALLASIKKGKGLSFISEDADGESLVAFTPLPIGVSDKPWSIGTIVPMSAITSGINSILLKTILLSAIGLAVLIVSVVIISGGITKPINAINQRLKELAKGQIRKDRSLTASAKDEIGEMVDSVNTLELNLDDKIRFAVEIGAGKFDTTFHTAGENDTLGIALETMRNNLKQFREEEEKRIWANEGLAKLNDVLRMNLSNNEDFYHLLLKTLLHFLRANQGAIFLVEQEEGSNEKYIELVSAYAYDRRKYVTNRLSWGQSLIGQCIIEKEITYLKEIPKEYIKITSGLGQATPKVIIIVPLKTDTEVVGAIEIASFSELAEHEIQFIEKAGEIISASIFNYRNAARTKVLLEKAQLSERQYMN